MHVWLTPLSLAAWNRDKLWSNHSLTWAIQVYDCLEMLGQACDPFGFRDVLPGSVIIPGCLKDREHAFVGRRLIAAATANEELVLSIWQIDWRVCI